MASCFLIHQVMLHTLTLTLLRQIVTRLDELHEKVDKIQEWIDEEEDVTEVDLDDDDEWLPFSHPPIDE